MMTVKYNQEQGGEIIMENVTTLIQSRDGVELHDLFGERLVLSGARLDQADFDKGISWIFAEGKS